MDNASFPSDLYDEVKELRRIVRSLNSRDSVSSVELREATEVAVSSYPVGCRVIRSSAMTIPNAVEITVPWNSESYDPYNMHDISTNPERITAPEDGDYLISSFMEFDPGIVASAIRIYKNATSLGFYYMPGSVTSRGEVSATRVERLAVGDFIFIQTFQSSGAPRNLALPRCYLSVTKL